MPIIESAEHRTRHPVADLDLPPAECAVVRLLAAREAPLSLVALLRDGATLATVARLVERGAVHYRVAHPSGPLPLPEGSRGEPYSVAYDLTDLGWYIADMLAHGWIRRPDAGGEPPLPLRYGALRTVVRTLTKTQDLDSSFGRCPDEPEIRAAYDRALALGWIEREQWDTRVTAAGREALRTDPGDPCAPEGEDAA